MRLVLAILWTIILIVNIVEVCFGMPSSWVSVFVPITVLVLDHWLDYILEVISKQRKL